MGCSVSSFRPKKLWFLDSWNLKVLVANHLVFPPLLIWTIVIEDVSSAEDSRIWHAHFGSDWKVFQLWTLFLDSKLIYFGSKRSKLLKVRCTNSSRTDLCWWKRNLCVMQRCSVRWDAPCVMSTALSPSTAVHVTDFKNDEIKGKGREFDGQLAKDQSCPLSSKHSTLISTLTKKKN